MILNYYFHSTAHWYDATLHHRFAMEMKVVVKNLVHNKLTAAYM
jgi:hypothetical protein